MSDPARSGYECCRVPMVPIRVKWLTADMGPAAYLCERCGVYKHCFSPQETQLRALVDTHMAVLLAAMDGDQA